MVLANRIILILTPCLHLKEPKCVQKFAMLSTVLTYFHTCHTEHFLGQHGPSNSLSILDGIFPKCLGVNNVDAHLFVHQKLFWTFGLSEPTKA